MAGRTTDEAKACRGCLREAVRCLARGGEYAPGSKWLWGVNSEGQDHAVVLRFDAEQRDGHAGSGAPDFIRDHKIPPPVFGAG